MHGVVESPASKSIQTRPKAVSEEFESDIAPESFSETSIEVPE